MLTPPSAKTPIKASKEKSGLAILKFIVVI